MIKQWGAPFEQKKYPPSVRRWKLMSVVVVLTLARATPIFAHGLIDSDEQILEGLVQRAIAQHPSILAARAQENALMSDLDAARWQRFPLLSVQSLSSGQQPAAILNIKQIIWDSGRVSAQIGAARAGVKYQGAQLEELQYQLALRVIEAWTALHQAKGKQQVYFGYQHTLERYVALMKRRVDAQISPPIELELLEARIAQAKVTLDQAMASANVAQSKLNLLLGASYSPEKLMGSLSLMDQVVRITTTFDSEPVKRVDEMIEFHPSVVKAREQAQSVRYQLAVQRAAQWPEVYVAAQKQFGGLPDPYQKSVYVGIQYSPGAGLSSMSQALSAEAKVKAAEESVEVSIFDLRESLLADLQEWDSAKRRWHSLERSEVATMTVAQSYERQFIAGRRNWQEVLNAARENVDVNSGLIDAQASLLGAGYRLRVRMGQMVWQNHESELLQKAGSAPLTPHQPQPQPQPDSRQMKRHLHI